MAAQTEVERYDALVVLGHSFSIKNGHPDLSLSARMTGRAAGILFQMGVAPLIIFSGGYTAGREGDRESEAKAICSYTHKRFPSIPPEASVLEEQSFDTLSNAEQVANILRARGIQKAALLTRGDHLPRTQLLFSDHGIQTKGYTCEQVLANNHKNSVRYINRLEKLFYPGHHLITRLKENVFTFIHRIDKNAKLQRLINKRKRKAY